MCFGMRDYIWWGAARALKLRKYELLRTIRDYISTLSASAKTLHESPRK
jgi:hypothetical protein